MKSLKILGMIFAALSAGTLHAETITLRADSWCPYNCEPTDAHPGYMVEIAKAALEPAGHKVEYATLNWARAIAESRTGKYSGIIAAAKSDAPDFIFPSVTLGKARNCFFTKPDSTWAYSGVASLPTIPVGAIKDYTYGDDFDKYLLANEKDIKKIDIVSGDNPLDLNLKKVQMGRIGAFIESEAVLRNFLFTKKLPEATLRNAGCLSEEDDLFIAFSPKLANAAVYADLIAKKVEAMRKDGSLAKLLAQYGISDFSR